LVLVGNQGVELVDIAWMGQLKLSLRDLATNVTGNH